MAHAYPIPRVNDYIPLIGREAVERLRSKAAPLRDARVADVNSTFYGGGVSELLYSSTILLNDLGIRSEWRVIAGPPDFFGITKKMHNALQGGSFRDTELKREIYEGVIHENAIRNDLEHDFVFVHDPQPLALVNHYKRHGPWIWRCHVDLTRPHERLWAYLREHIERYDAAILSLPEYAQELRIPQVFIEPAIDPFSLKNKELCEEEIAERLAHHGIPRDLPLVVQVSRFDPWKDPEGVVRAFEIASRHVDARLVLLGNVATDDPEGKEVFESLLRHQSDRVRIVSAQDTVLVNALQRAAAVVLQKSTREGFGLTVTEAMWKGAAVIGGNVGGIRRQIEDGVSGFLVSTVEEAAARIVRLIRDPDLRRRLGERARGTVRERFLMTRYVEEHLDLMRAFETTYRLRPGALRNTRQRKEGTPHAPRTPVGPR